MFFFFAKIQKRVIDANDPQRRWILCPGVGGGGGGLGTLLNKCLYGEKQAASRSNPLPFYMTFFAYKVPLS